MYTYKMVQIPPAITVKQKEAKGQEAAWYLQELVNRAAAEGWEFYRVDEVGVLATAGCMAKVFGGGNVYTNYFVVTFRKQAGSAAGPPPLP